MIHRRKPVLLIVALAGVILLSACGGGGNGAATVVPDPPPPPPPPVVNTPPTIGGPPPTTVVQDTPYSFQPTASDADGDTLTFSINLTPVWASFDTATGELTGTPGGVDIGTTSGIIISVADDEDSASLPPFDLTVTAVVLGSALVSWMPPTENTDGSMLNDLDGFKLYYGTSPGSYSQEIDLDNSGLVSFMIENLAPGTYYFAVSAYDIADNEGPRSIEVSKTIP